MGRFLNEMHRNVPHDDRPAIVFAQYVSETKTILVFGDSLSDGFMLKRSEAYTDFTCKKAACTA